MTEEFFMFNDNNVNAMPIPQPDCNGYKCLDRGNVPLAMAYVAIQKYENLYTPEEALRNGTLFIDLNKPFLGKIFHNIKGGEMK